MIIEEIRKYINLIELEDPDLLHEMANVGPKRHGIENVYIFIGSVEGGQHWLRVKVSNIPGKYDKHNSFVITMPDLYYDPDQVAEWITPKIMKQIISWIKLNQKVLHDYEIGEVTDTDVFLDSLSKV